MIVRNGTFANPARYPGGRDMGPAQMFHPATDLSFLMGPGKTGEGKTAFRITSPKPVRPNGGVDRSPVTRTIQRLCAGCTAVFTVEENSRRLYCTVACKSRAAHRRNRPPKRPKADPAEPRMCQNHPDRRMVAFDLCGTCYEELRRRRAGKPERHWQPAECVNHPGRKPVAHGVCNTCYMRRSRAAKREQAA